MRTVRTKVYSFNELSNEAQQKAIEKYRNGSEIYLEFFNDAAIEQINNSGFYDDVKLQYSLSYCQGDGLSFSCNHFDSEKLKSIFKDILGEGKEKTIELIYNDCNFVCTANNGNYCFASKNDIDFTFENYNREYQNIKEVVGNVLTKIENKYLELCKQLEKQGYSEIEYQQSDEAIKETILANDYEFTKDGNQF